jgi:hypothetical protein
MTGTPKPILPRFPILHANEVRWFEVGKTYKTLNGDRVRIEADNVGELSPNYRCVKGSDGIWRYDRAGDRGRCTGTSGQSVHNLIAGALD